MNHPTIRCRLDAIRIDGNTQPRTGINETVVREYTEAMLAGDEFPLMVCFWDGSQRVLASGFHRYFAHKAAGAVEVEVEQRNGTLRDAMLYAAGTNAHHGLRRSNEDKRRAVRMLLEDAEWSKWPDREIARRTGTTHPFVGQVRAELNPKKVESVTTPKVEAEPETPAEDRGPAQRQQPARQAEVESVTTPPAPPADDEGPGAAELLDEMQADVRKAEARVAELEKALTEDGKEAVVKLSQRLEHAERRQGELQEDAAKLKQARDFYERQLARCGKAVGQRDLDKIAPAVEAFVRAHAKVAA